MTTSPARREQPTVLAAVQTDGAQLVEVEIVTRQGARYVFPDMNADNLSSVLPPTGRVPDSISYLMLYNYSGAVVSIPIRIVEQVRVGEEVLWKAP